MTAPARPRLFRPLSHFWVAFALTVWNLLGCYLCYLQVRYRTMAMGGDDPVQAQGRFRPAPARRGAQAPELLDRRRQPGLGIGHRLTS